VELHIPDPALFVLVVLLVALFSSAGGLALGCSVNQTHIGLMFALVVAPMIFFGCTYYPWTGLGKFPVLQKIILINPLVHASEGLRGVLVPQFPHLSLAAVIPALIAFNLLLFFVGLNRFRSKAVS
jgi:ABC-2 type transport system permease protein